MRCNGFVLALHWLVMGAASAILPLCRLAGAALAGRVDRLITSAALALYVLWSFPGAVLALYIPWPVPWPVPWYCAGIVLSLSWLLAASTLLGFTLAHYWCSSSMVLLLALFWLFPAAVLSLAWRWHCAGNPPVLAPGTAVGAVPHLSTAE